MKKQENKISLLEFLFTDMVSAADCNFDG